MDKRMRHLTNRVQKLKKYDFNCANSTMNKSLNCTELIGLYLTKVLLDE